MSLGVLPRLAGVPDIAALEKELRERLERIEALLNEIRDRMKPLDDRGI
ncbi:MAG: hypothetical protein ACYDHE_17130 [Candidatus Acidiferrales bacterium]